MQLYLDSYVHVSENGNEQDYKSDNSSTNQQPIFAMPIIFISDDHRMKKIKCVNIDLNLNTKVLIDKKLFDLNKNIERLITLCDISVHPISFCGKRYNCKGYCFKSLFHETK